MVRRRSRWWHCSPGKRSCRQRQKGFGGVDDQWVVIQEAYPAVALAEDLHADPREGDQLFTPDVFRLRYARFRAWVNGPAGQRLGMAPIPNGPVNLRMLRRTLAIELAYRPGGLLAAKVHLKHISVATTEGYAARPGGAQARLLAEIGEHEQQRNLDVLIAEFRNFQAGVRPAGPGARELTSFFATVDGQLSAAEPGAMATDQQLRNLLARRAHTLHLGPANYCWFIDPAKALCLKLAGVSNADKPLIGMCDSARCPQATHHPCHRPVWVDTMDNGKVFLAALGRGQKTERARLEAEVARAQRIVAEIDAASVLPETEENH
jgi:hypothetical protein